RACFGSFAEAELEGRRQITAVAVLVLDLPHGIQRRREIALIPGAEITELERQAGAGRESIHGSEGANEPLGDATSFVDIAADRNRHCAARAEVGRPVSPRGWIRDHRGEVATDGGSGYAEGNAGTRGECDPPGDAD